MITTLVFLVVGLVGGPLLFVDGFRRCLDSENVGGFIEGLLGTILTPVGIWLFWLSSRYLW